jgi:hypothetical protein
LPRASNNGDKYDPFSVSASYSHCSAMLIHSFGTLDNNAVLRHLAADSRKPDIDDPMTHSTAFIGGSAVWSLCRRHLLVVIGDQLTIRQPVPLSNQLISTQADRVNRKPGCLIQTGPLPSLLFKGPAPTRSSSPRFRNSPRRRFVRLLTSAGCRFVICTLRPTLSPRP